MPVDAVGRMTRGAGVSAEGMRSARAASIWRRRVAAEGMAGTSSLYLRLSGGWRQGGKSTRSALPPSPVEEPSGACLIYMAAVLT